MEEILIQFTFGLPAILLALLLSLAGLIAKKPLLLALGGWPGLLSGWRAASAGFDRAGTPIWRGFRSL